jgi:hypothetical protein
VFKEIMFNHPARVFVTIHAKSVQS